MSTRTGPPSESITPAPAGGLVRVTSSGREAMKLYEREIATYLRELPSLLAEGHADHHGLIKGDEVVSVWDTQADAIQAARERFGIEPVFVKAIDARDPERFALLDFPKASSCPS